MTYSHTKIKGDIGETIAANFLCRKGFAVLCRNYRKPWGELDIVAEKDGLIHFVEVKSISANLVVSQSTNIGRAHQPEENVDGFKLKQIRRMVQTFLAETNRGADAAFEFHVLCVFLDMQSRKARIKWIDNVIL